MKTKILVMILLAFFLKINSIYSQNINEKLLVKYDAQKLETMKNNNPDGYYLLDYFVNKACYVIDMPDKPINYIELRRVNPGTGALAPNQSFTIDEVTSTSFNPLNYNIAYNFDTYNYYKVGETGKLIVVPSLNDLEQSAKNYQRLINKN